MNFSIIIPAINEQHHIARAIESAADAGANEVIVVDGGSEDSTVEIAHSLDCLLVTSAAGRGTQLHAGAKASTGDVLLFLHADNRLHEDCLKQIEKLFSNRWQMFGAFRQRIEADGWKFRMLEAGNAARIRWFGLTYGDQAIFCRRDFYFQIGGFPEQPLMEDVAFARKAKRTVRPAILPGPVVVNSRRWQERGVIRQTIRNWSLLAAWTLGVPVQRLARAYRRHDKIAR